MIDTRPLLDPPAVFLTHAGRILRFGARSFKTLLTSLPELGEVSSQCIEIGIGSLLIVVAVSIFIGMTIAVEGFATFRQLGGENMVAIFAGMVEVRELCPAIAAGVITAKAGTRMAASIGLMRIKEQIDALEVMAVDPYRYIVAPRVIATALMTPCLILVSNVAALGSTYLLSTQHLGLDKGAFIDYTLTYLRPQDFLNGMFKGAVFGIIISIICCYFGFIAERGPEGVGRATNRAVVINGVVVIFVNLFLTEMMYG